MGREKGEYNLGKLHRKLKVLGRYIGVFVYYYINHSYMLYVLCFIISYFKEMVLYKCKDIF